MIPGSRWESLGPLGRRTLPLHLGRDLPPVVALACYFDDSFSNDMQIHVVGGYLAPVQMWDEIFTPAWDELIKSAPHTIPEYKANKCRNNKGIFGPPWTKDECREFTIKVVDLILSMPIYAGVSAAFFWPGVPHRESKTLARDKEGFAQIGYGMSVGSCLARAFVLGQHVPAEIESVQPVLDRKQKFHKRAAINFDAAKRFVGRTVGQEFASRLLFPIEGDSVQLAPLQAADLLAYETYKEVVGRCEHIKPSTALNRLITGRTAYWSDCMEIRRKEYEAFRAERRRPRVETSILFGGGKPLRSPGTWGIR